jgi:hypothetical protein
MKTEWRHLTEEHLARVLDKLLNLNEEGNSLPSVEQSVVICQGEVHHLESISTAMIQDWVETHRSDLDLSIYDDGLVLDGMQTEHGCLGQVDDRCTHERTENSAVADSEGSTSHVLDGELIVASLLSEIRNSLLDTNKI